MSYNTKAIVFDMDGVIFDSEKLVIECWKVIADKYNIPDIEKACYECFGLNRVITRDKMLNIYGEYFPYDDYKKEMSDLFHSRYGGGKLPKKKGIHELLEYLKSKSIRIALASSTRSEVVKAELRDGDLIDYFDVIIGGDMVEKSKPEPDIYLKACEKLGILPEEAYGIEDSYNGVRAVYRAGMKCIMVPDLVEPDDEMKKISKIILPSLFEVKDYFIENLD